MTDNRTDRDDNADNDVIDNDYDDNFDNNDDFDDEDMKMMIVMLLSAAQFIQNKLPSNLSLTLTLIQPASKWMHWGHTPTPV